MVLLGLIVLYVFRSVIWGEKNFLLPGDPLDITYFGYVSIARAFKQAGLPLWDPHVFAGLPLVGYPQFGLFYPLNWVFWLWPYQGSVFPYHAYHALVIFHLWLAGVSAYALSYSLVKNKGIALLAGISYMLTPNIMMFLGWGNQIPSFAWFPLVWLFINQAVKRNSVVQAGWAGVALGILILTSPAQPAIMGLMFAGFVYGLAGLFYLLTEFQSAVERLVRLGLLAFITFAIGGLIGSVALVPVMEYMPHTIRFLGEDGHVFGRQKIPMHAMLRYKSSPQDLLGFLLPEKSGTQMGYTFFGYLTFLFSLVGLSRIRRQDVTAFTAAGLAVFSLIYALGWYLPFVFYRIPFLNLIREPNKYLYYLSLSFLVLASLGLKQTLKFFQSRARQTKLVWLALGLAVADLSYLIKPWPYGARQIKLSLATGLLLWAWLRIRKHAAVSRSLVVLAALVVALDITTIPPSLYSPQEFDIQQYLDSQSALKQFIPPAGDFYRVSAVESSSGWPYSFNAAQYLGFYDMFGYGNPLYYPVFDFRSRNDYCGRYYDLFSVKYFITYDKSEYRLLDSCGKGVKFVKQITGVQHVEYQAKPQNQPVTLQVYQNLNPQPWARAISQTVPLPADRHWMEVINQDVAFGSAALIESPIDYQLSQDWLSPEASFSYQLLDYQANRIVAQMQTDQPVLVEVAEAWYPGWRVYVDGQESKLWQLNHVFRGVSLTPGKHRVEFVFRPSSLLLPVGLASSTILTWLGYLLVRRRWAQTKSLAVLVISLSVQIAVLTATVKRLGWFD